MSDRADTIVALASATGQAALAIVRLSGPRTSSVLRGCLRANGWSGQLVARCARHAWLVDPRDGEALDEVLVTFFAAPRSYTGEDLAEVGLHGSPSVVADALRIFEGLGARAATPGEFTRRALRNGKLDLARAEAVLDLIEAESAEAAKLAVRHLGGALSRRYQALHDELALLRGLLEGPLEFPDETAVDADAALDEVARRAREVGGKLEGLAASHALGRRIADGAEVRILGRPNVGKSSIFNQLLRSERAIVHPRAGTTRDLVEARMAVGGGRLVRILDTAGLTVTEDEVEAEGIRRALTGAEDCDLVLQVVDASAPLHDDDLDLARRIPAQHLLVVLNKVDLGTVLTPTALAAHGIACPSVAVSARTGVGIDGLRELLGSALATRGAEAAPHPDAPVTSARQHGLLLRAAGELTRVCENLSASAPELAVEDLRSAESMLEQLVGRIADEEVLDRVFQRFCIGK